MQIKKTKKTETSARVFEILKLLILEPRTKNEILDEIIKLDNIEPIYGENSLDKYFNTFDFLGLPISANKNKIELNKFPAQEKLTLDEAEALAFLEMFGNKICNNDDSEILHSIINKIIKSIDLPQETTLKDIKEKLNNKYQYELLIPEDINQFDYYKELCNDGFIIEIEYKNNVLDTTQIIQAVPLEFIYKIRGSILRVFNKTDNENLDLLISNIISIKQTTQKSKLLKTNQNSIINFIGRLKQTYEIKIGEIKLPKTLKFFSSYTSSEDKYTLAKRMLKYGKNAKIQKGTKTEEIYKLLLNKTINLYKEEDYSEN